MGRHQLQNSAPEAKQITPSSLDDAMGGPRSVTVVCSDDIHDGDAMLIQHNEGIDVDTDADTDDHDDHSPESAGLARGLARSAAQRGASRAAVGRLPTGTTQHAGTTAAAAAAGKGATRAAGRVPKQFRTNPRAVARPSTAARVRGGRIRSSSAPGSTGKVIRTARPAPRANAAPRGGRVVNVRQVAKASERASAGLDLVEAASSENDRHGQQQQRSSPAAAAGGVESSIEKDTKLCCK